MATTPNSNGTRGADPARSIYFAGSRFHLEGYGTDDGGVATLVMKSQ